MTKLRVYEYAKKLNMSSKEILTILGRLDVPVANHMSVMDDRMVEKVEKFFSDVKSRAAQKHATEVERDMREKQRQRERTARVTERDASSTQVETRTEIAKGVGTPLNQNERKANEVSSTRTEATPASAVPSQVEKSEVSSVDKAPQSNQQSNVSSSESTTQERTPVASSDERSGQVSDRQPSSGGDRPQGQGSYGDRRPQGQGSYGDRRPQGQGSYGDRRPQGQGSYGDRRPQGQGGYGDRRPQGQGGQGGYGDRRPQGQGGQGGYGDRRPQGQGGQGGYGDRRPQGQGGQGGYGDRRPQGQGGQGGYGDRRPQGQGGQGGYGDRRPQGQGGYGDRRPQGQGGQGGYGDRRPQGQGGYGGRPQGQGGQGGYGDRRPQGQGGQGGYGDRRPQGQGGYGDRRPQGQGGYGGRPQGQGGFGGGRPGGGNQGGGFGGGRPGGGGGGGGGGRNTNASTLMAQSQKPTSSNAMSKNKDKDRAKENYDRDRKEQFNEDKLIRGGKRRGGSQLSGQRVEPKKPDFPTQVTVEGPMTVADFAKLLKRDAPEIIKKLLFLGIMATINQEIDTDAMELIAGEFGVEMTVVEPVDEEQLDMLVVEDKQEDLQSRPPVVTIMGHVDHGKTTLLDAIRESKVTSTESGGITQHIGAYQVEIDGRKITFLDTPGHEAFTTMRARGAQVTDITILVVAADDGVMPQTVEAINHAKAANVPIIVAVNKMDKPGANPDRVKQELMGHGLSPEEWGGDTIFVGISALKREGLDTLLEMVLLVADVAELKANPTGRPRGTVIDARLDKGRGTVATVLVQNGTLKVGDIVVAGQSHGRVRAMVNDTGRRLKEAGPSTPVEIQGFGDVPSAGDLFVVYDDERAARNLVQKRQNRERAEQLQNSSRVTLDDLYRQIQEGNMKDLNVIVKADVQGSVEALVQSIEKIDVAGVRVKVIHRGAGAITESDIALASASNAIVIGFHVRPDVNAQRAVEREKVDVRLYRVIYSVIEELESAMKGMLDPEYKEVVLGHVEVRQTFHISKVGTVAGCYVTDGKVTRDAEVRVIRDSVVVFEGKLDTLKRFKDEAKEVVQGYECGVTLERYNDIKVGDVIEAFKMEAVKVK